MSIEDRMLANLNAVIQRVANDSGSELIQNIVMVEQIPPNSADCVFKGTIDLWARFYATGTEVKVSFGLDRGPLYDLVKTRIQNSLIDIMELAQSELKKLGVEVEVLT